MYTGKIKVTWVKPALNGSTLTGYTVYRSYDKKTWTKIKTVSASTLSYTWTGPAKGKRYYFGVARHEQRRRLRQGHDDAPHGQVRRRR